MKTKDLLFSAVHFFVTCFIIGVGVLFLTLPYAAHLRVALVNFLLEPGEACRLIGASILGFGSLLFIAIFRLNRRNFLALDSADIDKGVIQEVALDHFQQKFPDEEWSFDVAVHPKGRLEIFTSGMGQLEEEEFEGEWKTFLGERLHYFKPFTLTFVET
ncbi:hypothetical protein [Candidatus Neptunochlamydia vexilliferae]|uniref:Uncharacterized protein n=1 Tax=Candidatus Neptunichlamydia vexilliferae TaxID=1651774 RepID=A0ABS0AWP8_9BACT|nr:hypothetical protein [Candidatus Neptunochlamydia vexilliferae]MBF5058563.1 hypothetical protein [Candidatus Neptunochlamydia vexilliferae]